MEVCQIFQIFQNFALTFTLKQKTGHPEYLQSSIVVLLGRINSTNNKHLTLLQQPVSIYSADTHRS